MSKTKYVHELNIYKQISVPPNSRDMYCQVSLPQQLLLEEVLLWAANCQLLIEYLWDGIKELALWPLLVRTPNLLVVLLPQWSITSLGFNLLSHWNVQVPPEIIFKLRNLGEYKHSVHNNVLIDLVYSHQYDQ